MPVTPRTLFPLVAVAALVAAGCGGSSHAATTATTASTTTTAAASGLYAYDPSAPLDVRDRGVVNHGYPIAVHDISYRSPRGGRVPAYLAVPPGKGRHPAVIYLHGSGGNRLQFLVEATWMAARGAVAMTIDSPYARTPAPVIPRGLPGLSRQRDLEAQTVVDLRRAVDLLQRRPDVDPHRIAFVGWSAGAKSGALLAGADHRIRAFDLMSGGSLPPSTYAAAAPAALRPELLRVLGSTDPLAAIAHAAPSALLLQDGLHDQVVPRAALDDLARAASEPKEVRWYDQGHAPGSAAFHDQLRWLAARLGLGGPVVRRAHAGP
jgi:dienelactone hydrolase